MSKAKKLLFPALLAVITSISGISGDETWRPSAIAVAGETPHLETGVDGNPLAVPDVQRETLGRINIFTWTARQPRDNVQVVCLPGLGLCAQGYDPVARELTSMGITTHVIDAAALGHTAGSSGRDKVSLKRTTDDIHSALQSIRKRNPDCRIVILGESIGAVLALRIASESPQDVDGIICAAPAWKIYGLAETAVKGLVRPFESNSPGWAARGIIRHVTVKPELRHHLSTHPAHVVDFSLPEAFTVTRLMAQAPQYAAHVNSTPVLFVQGMRDALVKPSASAMLFKRIPNPNKTFILDMEAEHLVFEEGQVNKQVLLTTAEWLRNLQRAERFAASPIGLTVANNYDDARMIEAKRLFKAAGLPEDHLRAAAAPDALAIDVTQFRMTHLIP